MDTTTRLLFSVVFAASLILPAGAAVIAQYDFSGSPGDQVVEAPDITIANASASNLSRSFDLTPVPLADSINSSNWPTTSGSTTAFYSIELFADAGYKLNLTSINFSHLATDGGAGFENQAPSGYRVRVNVDPGPVDFFGVTSTAGPETTMIDLSGSEFQNLDFVRVEFFASNSGTNQNGQWALVNGTSGGLVVNGSVVPESSAFLFCVGGALACLLWRRRPGSRRAGCGRRTSAVSASW